MHSTHDGLALSQRAITQLVVRRSGSLRHPVGRIDLFDHGREFLSLRGDGAEQLSRIVIGHYGPLLRKHGNSEQQQQPMRLHSSKVTGLSRSVRIPFRTAEKELSRFLPDGLQNI